MSLLLTNATISVTRLAYNPATKQSVPATVLTGVPVYLVDVSEEYRLKGLSAGLTMRMYFDPAYDIRDGDQVTGWQPVIAQKPVVWTVQHVAARLGLGLDHRVCILDGRTQ